MKKVIMRTSGVDSVCVDFLEKPDIRVYYDIGEDYNKTEMQYLPKDTIIDNSLNLSGKIIDEFILPRRNAIFSLMCAEYGDLVLLSTTSIDGISDASYEFILAMNNLLSVLEDERFHVKKSKVIAPYRHLTKVGLVRTYLQKGGSVDELQNNTWSCYSGGDIECGKCKSCLQKYVSFVLNGIDCSNSFKVNPYDFLHLLVNRSKDETDEIESVKELFA